MHGPILPLAITNDEEMFKLIVVLCAFIGALLLTNLLPFHGHTALAVAGWQVSWGMVITCFITFLAMRMKAAK